MVLDVGFCHLCQGARIDAVEVEGYRDSWGPREQDTQNIEFIPHYSLQQGCVSSSGQPCEDRRRHRQKLVTAGAPIWPCPPPWQNSPCRDGIHKTGHGCGSSDHVQCGGWQAMRIVPLSVREVIWNRRRPVNQRHAAFNEDYPML